MSLADVNLRLVDSLDEAHAFLNWLGERRPVLACDTETIGLKYTEPAFLRMAQFGDGETGWAISSREWKGVVRKALDAVVTSGQPLAFWNVKFDMHALEADGLPLPAWHKLHDGLVMDHLLDPLRPHGLKAAGDRLYPGASSGQGMLRQAMSKNGWDWATVPEDFPAYWAYAAADAVLTARLVEHYWPQVNAQGLRPAYDREMQTLAVLYRAERRGMRIDNLYTANLRDAWQTERAVLQAELADLGVPNPSSNSQVTAALKAAGWEPEEFTATGAAKLDKVILAQLAKTFGIDVAERVLRYKRITKWNQAYLTPFLGTQDAAGKVHCSINTLAAKTGRMSITDPPLQTLPRGPEIRDCVIPDPGSRLLAVDFDGVEFRLLAHYANEPAMQQAIRDDVDPHRWAASLVYGIPMDEVSSEQRQVTKNTQYGKIYGAGYRKIAETAGIPEAEAQQFVTAYEAALPGVLTFMREVENLGRTRLRNEGRAYVNTWGGRTMTAPEDGLYKLVNGLIQGSCADIFKQAIVDLDAAGYGDLILLPVHDEVIFDVPEEDFEDVAVDVCRVMERMTEFAVPLTVAASEPLDRWGSKYDKSRAMPPLKRRAVA